MKRILHTLKKHWITVWLIVAVVGTVSFFVTAEYIEDSNRAKRVIANTSGAGVLFSSDYLTSANEPPVSEIPCGSEDDNGYYDVSVRIWNYDSSNPTFFYDLDDITYNLTAQLYKKDTNDHMQLITDPNVLSGVNIYIKKDGAATGFTAFLPGTSEANATASVTENAGATNQYTYSIATAGVDTTNGSKVTFTGLKLFKAGRDENKIVLRFPKSMRTSEDKIYVKLTASLDGTYSGIDDRLWAYISIKEESEKLSQGWSGDFSEKVNTQNYDGFNYVISGNGSAKIKFKWLDAKFEINPFFISKYGNDLENIGSGKIGTDGVWKYIIINANSETTYDLTDPDTPVVARQGIGRYDIQLYMKDAADTYSAITNYAGYEFVP
jgi:hypothetical protein